MRTFKRILGVLLIFIFGVFIGITASVAGARFKLRDMLLGGPDAVMSVVVKRLDHELQLDQEQKRKLQGIVDDARIRLRQTHARIEPEVDQILHDAEERTRAILYPQQIKKFNELVTRSREKWKPGEHLNPAGTATPGPTAATPGPTQTAPAPAEPSNESQEPKGK